MARSLGEAPRCRQQRPGHVGPDGPAAWFSSALQGSPEASPTSVTVLVVPLIPPQPLPATGGDSEVESMEAFARLEAEPEARWPRRDRSDQALPPEAPQMPTRGIRGRPELPGKVLSGDRMPLGGPA